MKIHFYLIFILTVSKIFGQDAKVALFKGNTGTIMNVVFSPDSSSLLALSEDAAVLYRISDGRELARLETESFCDGYLTKDGKVVLISDYLFGRYHVNVYDFELKNKFSDFVIMKKDKNRYICEGYYFDGSNIITIEKESIVKYSLTDGSIIEKKYLKKDLSFVSFSDDMQKLAFASIGDYNIYIYDLEKGIVTDTISVGNEKINANRTKTGSGIYWDREYLAFIFRNQIISETFCSKDDKNISMISVHDLKTGKENIIEYREGRESPCYFDMSPDGSDAIISNEVDGVKIISISDKRVRLELKPEKNIVYMDCAFSIDGKYVFVSYELRADENDDAEDLYFVTVLDAKRLEKIVEVNGDFNFYDQNTGTMAFGMDYKLSWVNLNKPDSIITVQSNVITPRHTAVNSTLGLMAACYEDSTIIVFDIDKGEEKYRFKTDFLTDRLEFSNNSKYMLYHEYGADLFILDALTGKQVNRLSEATTNILGYKFFTEGGRIHYEQPVTRRMMIYDIDKDSFIYECEKSQEHRFHDIYYSDTLVMSFEFNYKNLKIKNLFSSELTDHRGDLYFTYSSIVNVFGKDVLFKDLTNKSGYMRYNLVTRQTEKYNLHPDIKYHADIDYKNKLLYYITVDKAGFGKFMVHSAENDVLKYSFDLGHLNKDDTIGNYSILYIEFNFDKNLLFFQLYDYANSVTRFYFFNLTTFELIKYLEYKDEYLYEGVDFSPDYESFIFEVGQKIMWHKLFGDDSRMLYKARNQEENHFVNSGIIAKNEYDAIKFYNVNDASETKTFVRFYDGTEIMHNDCYFKVLKGSLEGKLYRRNSGEIISKSELSKYYHE